ncbi:MAG TPA: COX15/CtaA family protein [Gemmatimonadaceae bacterium]|nr:COX15/CtaA family protein [Gemmatimonadaceae bacterium]
MNVFPLTRERILGYIAVGLAFFQIVFGAIVRITGSGMGCGDHWPKCEGRFLPPLERPDLIIEVTHRYIALALSLVVLSLLISAIARYRSGGPDLRRSAALATALVIAAALLGAATVKLTLSPLVVVAHLTLAVALLATLAWFAATVGGFGAAKQASQKPATARTRRSSTALAAIVLLIVVLGALTANVPLAAGSCAGFPHCREIFAGGVPLWLHLTHRILAFAVLGHVVGVFIGARRRGESSVIRTGALLALILITAQILLAAAMVEMRFPPVFRSAHQALGSLIWLAAFTLALLARVRDRLEPAT